MAWTQDELNYFENNKNIFDTRDLSKILNSLNSSVVDGELNRKMANKIAFFSALLIDRDSVVLVVENRGKSKSSRRADAGQKIMRIHYGIKSEGLKPTGDENMPIVHISPREISPKVGVNLFEFTYFKGTLSPKNLKPLMFSPLITYNTSTFGKREEGLVKSIIDKVDWDKIDQE